MANPRQKPCSEREGQSQQAACSFVIIETCRKVADVMAIPMFLMLLCFISQPSPIIDNSTFRPLLLCFVVLGLIADVIFTIFFVYDLYCQGQQESSDNSEIKVATAHKLYEGSHETQNL